MITRTDISKYVIHSVRKPDQNDFPKKDYDFNENHYLPLTFGENLNNEIEVLTNIVREGGLRADISFRKGRPTIYGDTPVICFTEMPIINLLQYVTLRNNRSRFTEYGVAILKKELYDNGGRPVISGLSSTDEFEYLNASKRILKPEILPFAEQYRYVKLDLSSGNDWTHEREWRIACKTRDFTVHDDYHGTSFITYGLNIFSDMLFSEVILIVNTEQEAIDLSHDVQDQLDSGYAKGGQEFCNNIKYLIVEKAVTYISENNISNIEALPDNIYYKHTFEKLSEIEIQKVALALKKCSDLSKDFADEFFRLHNLDTDEKKQNFDISGFARVESYKSYNKFYRYMLSEDLGIAVGGSLWLKTISKYDMELQSISYREYICKRYCEILNQDLANIFTVSSNLD